MRCGVGRESASCAPRTVPRSARELIDVRNDHGAARREAPVDRLRPRRCRRGRDRRPELVLGRSDPRRMGDHVRGLRRFPLDPHLADGPGADARTRDLGGARANDE
ncbi:hypothetical protein PLANTIT3_50499 [Plantibacter sp. T3]|nr:hypothetical protein PLANTIT3_50499 [Plantibacter sp. T3]